jgi:hypothetical protein
VRHAATTSTLHTQLARETYGRRREIALRLAVVGREDQLVEAPHRWVRHAQETCAKENVPIAQWLDIVVRDAGDLLGLVDGVSSREDVGLTPGPGIGSVARIVAAQDAVRTLVEELQVTCSTTRSHGNEAGE